MASPAPPLRLPFPADALIALAPCYSTLMFRFGYRRRVHDARRDHHFRRVADIAA